MSKLKVLPHETLCPAGKVIEATPGVSICDTLLANGIEIEHACEKSCACTTCHVIVREGFDELVPATDKEDDLLDKAWGLELTSRLRLPAGAVGEGDRVATLHRYAVVGAEPLHPGPAFALRLDVLPDHRVGVLARDRGQLSALEAADLRGAATGRSVSDLLGLQHQHRPAGPSQQQGSGQAGQARSDDRHVVLTGHLGRRRC